MSAFWLIVAMASIAQAEPAPPTEATEEVIVTAPSLEPTRKALAECLKRKCSPLEDMAASLAHSDRAIVAGDYREARSTLKASLRRNRRNADTLPAEVSLLERELGSVALHIGAKRTYKQAAGRAARALRTGLPPEDPLLVANRIEAGDTFLTLRRTRAARAAYAQAARAATRIGDVALAAHAEVRSGWLKYLIGEAGQARRILRKVAANSDPRARDARVSAMLALVRMEREGSQDPVDELVRQVAALGLQRPVLLWQPPFDHKGRSLQTSPRPAGDVGIPASDAHQGDRWIDVGFWINKDGTVQDVEVLRSRGDRAWSAPMLRSLAGRRYSTGNENVYRVERYSLTSFWEVAPGTRTLQRSADTRIVYRDLTATGPVPSPEASEKP